TKVHRNFADIQIEPDFVIAAEAMEKIRSAKRGMPSERKFFLRSKDAHARSLAPFFLKLSRENKSCFRQVCFARDGLHLLRRKSARVGDDRELIAFEWTIGEDIHENVRKSAAGDVDHGVMVNVCLGFVSFRTQGHARVSRSEESLSICIAVGATSSCSVEIPRAN